MNQYSFQFCPKLVVFTPDFKQVLLCRRKGESDYNGTFAFIGGKMEVTDESIIAGIKREKDEEAGVNFKVDLYPEISSSLLFRKKDGSNMITSHYFAVYREGEIMLNPEEYSDDKWVNVDEIKEFEPKIPTIPAAIKLFLELRDKLDKMEHIII